MASASEESLWSISEHAFDAAHPTSTGHFPGRPIIPGALILDVILRAIGAAAPTHVQSVKFLRIVRPGDIVEVRWRERSAGATAFECRVRGEQEVAISGSLKASGL